MSTRHCRLTRFCVWLALLAYLTMSGIDDVHVHAHHVAASTGYTIITAIPQADEDNCPICAWHVVASACLLYLAWALAPLLFAVPSSEIARHRWTQVINSAHSRGPPYLRFA